MKQSSLDEQEQMNMEMDAQNSENADNDFENDFRQFDDPASIQNGSEDIKKSMEQQMNKQNSIGNSNPLSQLNLKPSNCLPWAPKVRKKDVYQFMDVSRNKFIGYSLPDDIETIAGLPQPICEGINILKEVSN
jgi:hypothetical protein